MLSQMQDGMQETIEVLVDDYITDFPRLNHYVKERVADLLVAHSKTLMLHARALFKAEYAKPFTFRSRSTITTWTL